MIRTHNTGDYWVPQDTKYPVAAAGALFRNRSKPCTEEDVQLTPSQTYGVVTQENYMELSGNRVVLNTMGASNMKRVRPGDFIIHLRSFQGGIELSRIAGKVSNAYTVLEPSPLVDIEYFRWLLKSDVFINGLSSLTDQLRDGQSISFGTFSKLAFPLPPLETQRRIADYLDRETGQIDETITRIDRVVELLEERHQAFVDSCVQNSGKYAPLSLVIKQSQTGPFGTQLSAEEYVPGGIPIINPTHIQDEKIVPEKHISVSASTFERLKRFALSEGDLILGRKGDVRKSALMKASDLPALCGSDSLFLRPDLNQVNPSFLRWWFRSSEAFEHLSTHSVGATLAGLNQEIIQLTRVPLPPLDEQSNIVQRLEEDTSSNALMKEKAQTMRDLLLERRSAVITDAVTGRIEV